jgi:hypothetical protein
MARLGARPLILLEESRMAVSQRGLWMGFMRSAERFPDRPAGFMQGTLLSHRQHREAAIRIAASIKAHQEDSWMNMTAVFAHRNATAFAGILGVRQLLCTTEPLVSGHENSTDV